MEEEEQYKVEGQEPEQQEGAVAHCPVCGQVREPVGREEGQMPPSILVVRFAGPGSAQIEQMMGEGVVTPEQLGAAGLFMICRAFQEWSVPVMQMVAQETINLFMKELTKPRIEPARGPMPPGPGFYMPPRGGGPV